MSIINQAAEFLDKNTLSEANINFDALAKNDDLLKKIYKSIGKRNLTLDDKRVEMEDSNVLLSDFLTAYVSANRPQGKLCIFEFVGSTLGCETPHGYDWVLYNALSNAYTLDDVIAAADSYSYRRNNFELSVSVLKDSKVLKSVESGIRISYTVGGNSQFNIDLFESEAFVLLEELKKKIK